MTSSAGDQPRPTTTADAPTPAAPGTDRAAAARERMAAQRRQTSSIRRNVAAGTITAFVAMFAVVTFAGTPLPGSGAVSAQKNVAKVTTVAQVTRGEEGDDGGPRTVVVTGPSASAPASSPAAVTTKTS